MINRELKLYGGSLAKRISGTMKRFRYSYAMKEYREEIIILKARI